MPVRPRLRYCIRSPLWLRSRSDERSRLRYRILDRSGTLFRNYTERHSGKANGGAVADNSERAPRRLRADAARNVDSLLEAAKAVFATSGVDAPAKEIADLAGVGVGTLYRHFPQRSDLVKAVFQRGVDACADAAPALAAASEPAAALAQWLHRYTEFLATKRGLAAALHSGDPAFDALPGYFAGRLEPALGSLLEAAAASGEIRADISPRELLHAVATLCMPVAGDGVAYSQRMVALLMDGLRYGATASQPGR